jgi:hypothetical protein
LGSHLPAPQNSEKTLEYRGKIKSLLLTLCQEFWNLADWFSVSPGQYILEIGPQLFHINDVGDLMPFDLAWVGTNISVVQQPSEMMFYFDNMAREGNLFRGLPGRPLEAVLVREPRDPQTGRPQEQCFSVFIMNNTTNRVSNYMLPSPEEGLGLTLYDEKRNEIARTPLGAKLGQPLSMEGKSATSQFMRRSRLFMEANDAADGGQFKLFDYFDAKAPGTYKLVFVQRLYRLEANGKIAGVFLSPIIVPIEVNAVPNH